MSDSTPPGYPPPGQPNPYGQPPVSPPTPYPPYGVDPTAPPPVPQAPDPYAPPPAADPYAQPSSTQPYPNQPYSGQPYSGQPYSGQPYSGQPYSNPPTTGQPYPMQHEQPAYLAQPVKKPKTMLWVALAVVLALLLCIGGAGAWLLVSEEAAEDPLVISTAGPSDDASPSPKASPSAKATVTLTLPDQLGGKKRATDPMMESLADTMRKTLEGTMPGSGKTVAGIYGDMLKGDMLMVVGFEGAFPMQGALLDGVFKGLDTSGDVSNAVDIEPGPLGGKARCADVVSSGTKMATCSWIDEGSLGMIFFYDKTVKQVKSDFITYRSAIEKKQ